SSRRRHTRSKRDWSSDVCSSDLLQGVKQDQQSMQEELQGLKKSQQQMHHRFDVLESKVDQNQTDIVSIKESIARIERSVHEDVVTILETIEGNNQAKN